MESYLRASKPIIIDTHPLSCFFPVTFQDLNRVEELLTNFFDEYSFLKAQYKSLNGLWDKLLLARSSQRGEYLSILTKEFYLIIFDVGYPSVHFMKLNIAKEISPCSIDISYNYVVIGGFFQVLVVNWRNKNVIGIDFSNPVEFKEIDLSLSRTTKHPLWKKPSHNLFIEYDGEFRITNTTEGPLIKGGIGILYHKAQFDLLYKGVKLDTKVGINSFDLKEENYVLYVMTVTYKKNEKPIIRQKATYINAVIRESKDVKSLIFRANTRGDEFMIAINSAHKYFTQILTFNSETLVCSKIKPINIILARDTLPNDDNGITSMNIKDICWTSNNLFAAVYFYGNYYCILTCFGQPLSIVTHRISCHFHILPNSNKVYTHMALVNKVLCLFKEDEAIAIEYESNLRFCDLWMPGKAVGDTNRILRFITGMPKLPTSKPMLKLLEGTLNDEMKYIRISKGKEEFRELDISASKKLLEEEKSDSNKSKPQSEEKNLDEIVEEIKENKEIRNGRKEAKAIRRGIEESGYEEKTNMSVNSELEEIPSLFPSDIRASSNEIAGSGFILIEGIRWTCDISNNIYEILKGEIESLCHSLYLKNDPLYIIHILQMYEKFAKSNSIKTMTKGLTFYGIDLLDAIVESQGESFSFGKKKALFLFYCLIEFESTKSTSYSVLFIVISWIIYTKWHNKNAMSNTCDLIMSILGATGLVTKEEKNSCFVIANKASISDNGLLKQALFRFAAKKYLEPFKSTVDKNTKEKNKRFVFSLMELFEEGVVTRVYSIVNELMGRTGNIKNPLKELIGMKGKPISYIYDCASFLNRGKVDSILWEIKTLANSIKGSHRNINLVAITTCLLLIVLILIQQRTFKLYEVGTFLYKVITKGDLLKTFDQLKGDEIITSIKVDAFHKLPLGCTHNEQEMYNEIAILLQVSECKMAIELLTSSLDINKILFGLLILNNKVNEYLAKERTELVKEYLSIAIEKIKRVTKNYFSCFLKCDSSLIPGAFSACILLSGKVIGTVVAYLVLPSITSHLQSLIQAAEIGAEEIVRVKEKKSAIKPCTFIVELAGILCKSPNTTCQDFFNSFFPNNQHAILFNSLFQEAVEILMACIRTGMVYFFIEVSKKKKLIQISDDIPITLGQNIKDSLIKLIRVIWEVLLLLAVKELTQVKSLSSIQSIRLAGYMIRLSFIGTNEQKELEYIKKGLSILKEVNYTEINVVEYKEEIKILAKDLGIYAEKWSNIIKDEKEMVMRLIKKENEKLYNEFVKFLDQRSRVNNVTKNIKRNLNSDIIFRSLLEKLKEIIKDLTQEPLVKIGNQMRDNLRTSLSNINLITGMPSGFIVDRDEWILEKEHMFSEEYDKGNNSRSDIKILAELCENIKIDTDIKAIPKFDLMTLFVNNTKKHLTSKQNLLEPKFLTVITSSSFTYIRKSL